MGMFPGGGQIPSDPYSNDMGPSDNQDIETMCISPAEETLAISTDRGQLYSINLSAVDVKQVKLTWTGAPSFTIEPHVTATVHEKIRSRIYSFG